MKRLTPEPARLFISVSPYTVEVTVSGKDLRDNDNYPTTGLYFVDERKIVLSARMPTEDRIYTLVHELCHAFDFAYGRCDPQDEESWCNRVAAIHGCLSDAVTKWGGWDAFHSLFPDRRHWRVRGPLRSIVADNGTVVWSEQP